MAKIPKHTLDKTENMEQRGKMRRKSKKKERKNPNSNDAHQNVELDQSLWAEVGGKESFVARVVEVHKRYAFVSRELEPGKIDTSDVWLATVARRFLTQDRVERNFVSVGDIVLCRPAVLDEIDKTSELPQAVILHLSPRTNKLVRLDPFYKDRSHVLASNMDQLVFVGSISKPPIKWGLIDRYLVLAESQNLPVHIVLNKVDLLGGLKKEAQEQFELRSQYYKKIGYNVYVTQANSENTCDEIERLTEAVKGKISLFSGHSGVGKSSVVNRFDPEIIQEVEPDSDIFYKGRHTTTYASFIKLGIGGFIIDTPGIRSFCIEEFGAISLSRYFRDIEPFVTSCKYRECAHIEEPECAVKDAVKDGVLPEWRLLSYISILTGASGREGRLRDITL